MESTVLHGRTARQNLQGNAKMLINSKDAIAIIAEVTGNKGSRTTLKAWADQGRIRRVPIHAKCAMYDPDEIRQAAMNASKHKSTLGDFVGLEVAQ